MTNSILYANRASNTAKTMISRRCWRAALLAFAVHSLFANSSFAQLAPPPPLGPPTYRSDKTQIAVSVLTAFVKTKVAEIVVQTNETIHKQTSNVTVEALPLTVFGPFREPTKFTDRPNEYYIKLTITIPIKVKITSASDRIISIPLDVPFSCDGWQTGNGNVKILAKTGDSVVEGGNIVEDVIRVRDTINNLIKSYLTLPGAIAVPMLPISSCVTIGASPGPTAFIAYDQPNRLGPIRDLSRVTPTIDVTFQKLKRLRARGNGAILYNDTENIILDTYANFVGHQSGTLTMREGDEVTLNMPPSTVKASGTDLLVIIANILQQPTFQPEDSAFAVALRTANYSPGVHTLQITKVYVEPPGPGHIKPLQLRVPAYELTYSVRVTNPPVFQRTPR